MNFKDKLFIFPYFVVFFIDLAVLVFFAAYLFSGIFQWTKIFYLILILLIAVIIYFLRIKIIGDVTILDRFCEDKNFGQGLVGIVSLVLGVLITTILIVKTSWSLFLADFKRLEFTPIKWFEFLGSNYQQIVLYTFLIVVSCYILLVLISLTASFIEKKAVIKAMVIFGVTIVFILFVSTQHGSIWSILTEQKLISYILVYLFGGSLLYFNLFFLLRRPRN